MITDPRIFTLYAVTDRRWLNGRLLIEDIESALRGGTTLVQLREKGMDYDAFCNEAAQVCALCKRYGVPLIINDRVDVAQAAHAQGVHLGQGDMNPSEARRILGPGAIIGVTARRVEQAVQAEKDGADYLGSGAVFGTHTKSDAVKMSRETLEAICRAVHIPVVAIGGVTQENVCELKGTGIAGVAVASGLFAKGDIALVARTMRADVEGMIHGA